MPYVKIRILKLELIKKNRYRVVNKMYAIRTSTSVERTIVIATNSDRVRYFVVISVFIVIVILC